MLNINHKNLLLSDILLTREKFPDMSIREVVEQTLRDTNRVVIPAVVRSLVADVQEVLAVDATPIAYSTTPDEYKVSAIYEDGELREFSACGTSGILEYIEVDEGVLLSTTEELRDAGIIELRIEAIHEVDLR